MSILQHWMEGDWGDDPNKPTTVIDGAETFDSESLALMVDGWDVVHVVRVFRPTTVTTDSRDSVDGTPRSLTDKEYQHVLDVILAALKVA